MGKVFVYLSVCMHEGDAGVGAGFRVLLLSIATPPDLSPYQPCHAILSHHTTPYDNTLRLLVCAQLFGFCALMRCVYEDRKPCGSPTLQRILHSHATTAGPTINLNPKPETLNPKP